ncbi:MAG TPA: NAD(P)-dependent oxidoreductase [Chitinispirillaceae bacterium]|nr:NAD(P)-dependent oxidoreductase [Chitinispirillaceae bacterium]
MKKLLITGASGFLGWNLCSVASNRYSVIAVSNNNPIELDNISKRKCDITDYHQLKNLFISEKPDAVIHAAAASNPNFCQNNPEESFKINVSASINIAGLCADLQAACIFTSSDLVFNGKNPPYKEDDLTAPLNIYGQQKVSAEQQMRSRYENVTICRMPLMYGDAPDSAGSFIKLWIQKLIDGNTLNLFTDEVRTPVSALDASRGLLIALEKPGEIIHLGGQERLSRFDIGRILYDLIGNPKSVIKPCKQKDVPMAAPRPTDVSLDSSKAIAMGYNPGTIEEEVRKLKCLSGR